MCCFPFFWWLFFFPWDMSCVGSHRVGGDPWCKFVASRIAPVMNACYFVTYPFGNTSSSLDLARWCKAASESIHLMLSALFLGLWSCLPNTLQSLQCSGSLHQLWVCGWCASCPYIKNSRKKTTKPELVLLQRKGWTGGCAWNLTWGLKAAVQPWSRARSGALAVLVLFIQLLFNWKLCWLQAHHYLFICIGRSSL